MTGLAVVLTFMTCMMGHGGAPVRGTCELTAIPFEGSIQACGLFWQMPTAEWLREHSNRLLMGPARCSTKDERGA